MNVFITAIMTMASVLGVSLVVGGSDVHIERVSLPGAVSDLGYDEETVRHLIQDRLRTVARRGATARGEHLSELDTEEAALMLFAEDLGIANAIRGTQILLGLQAYVVHAIITEEVDQLRVTFSVTTNQNELFHVTGLGPKDDLAGLIADVADEFLLRIDPYLLAMYHFRRETPGPNFDVSMPLLEHCARVLPREVSKWPITVLGMALNMQGDVDGARAKYLQAHAIDPQFVFPVMRLGELEAQAGNHEEALRYYRKSLNLFPRNTGRPEHLMGLSYEALGLREDARRIYARGIRSAPENISLRQSIAKLYREAGQLEIAQRELRAALAINPDHRQSQRLLREVTDEINQAQLAASLARAQ